MVRRHFDPNSDPLPRPALTLRMGYHSPRNPFELSNLLHAGVLTLTLSGLDQNLLHPVFLEVWRAFDGETADTLRSFCSPEDATLLESLSFLVASDFARVTSSFLSLHTVLLLRVYLIPYDLPGVQGRLMNRQENTLVRCRCSLKGILPRITSDNDYWRGADVLPPNPSLFLPSSLVGVFVVPSKVIVVSELTIGLEDHGGDIQRAALSRTRRIDRPNTGDSKRFAYLWSPLHSPPVSTYIGGHNVAEGIALAVYPRPHVYSG